MKKFKVFITEENGNTLHVDNGVVVSNAARKPLPNNPDGWQDIVIGWERNISLYGIVRNFSLALGFVRDAAKILRKVCYLENFERKLSLLITMLSLALTDTTFAFNYLFLYKGDLDLSTIQDEAHKVTMQIMEGGISKLFNANKDTVYEFPLDDPDAKDLYCDGINLFQRVSYAIIDGLTYSGNKLTLAMVETGSEGLSADIINFDEALEGVPWGAVDETNYLNSSLNYYQINNGTQVVNARLRGTIIFKFNTVTWALFGVKKVYFYVRSNFGTTPTDVYTIDTPVIGTTYTFPIDFAAPYYGAVAGQKYFLVMQIGDTPSDSGDIDVEFLEGSVVASEFASRKAPTFIKIFTLYDLYRKLTGRITANESDAVSSLLAANLNICVTCGDAIRGFISPDGKSTAVIKTKMSDLFASANVQFNAGMGVELNKLTLEEKAHYFDSSNPTPLGEVKSLKSAFSLDLMFNTLKIGSAPQDYNDINGRQEFNNLTLFGTVITRIAKEFNLESPYRRDCYGFEYARINFDGKVTTDANSDNDVWLVNVETGISTDYNLLFFGLTFETVPNIIRIPVEDVVIGPNIIISDSAANNGTYTVLSVDHVTGFTLVTVLEALVDNTGPGNLYTNGYQYILKRRAYDNAALLNPDGTPDIGLLTPESVFNLEDMTIERLIEKHGNWIHSLMWGFENQVMPFQTTDKNRDLKTVQGSVIYDEDANIVIKDLAAPLFIPIYFEIETKVPVNLPSLLENNPAKCFSFTWEGNLYKGFLMKAGISISDNASQVFKLLSTPDNDLSKLVV